MYMVIATAINIEKKSYIHCSCDGVMVPLESIIPVL